jgi:hypothetical protein
MKNVVVLPSTGTINFLALSKPILIAHQETDRWLLAWAEVIWTGKLIILNNPTLDSQEPSGQ